VLLLFLSYSILFMDVNVDLTVNSLYTNEQFHLSVNTAIDFKKYMDCKPVIKSNNLS
jgi:hypothetical protein